MVEMAEKAGYTGILIVSNQKGLCTLSSRKGEKMRIGEGRGSYLGAGVCIDLCRYSPPSLSAVGAGGAPSGWAS